MLLHVVGRWRLQIDQEGLQLRRPYEPDRLWDHEQETCFTGVYNLPHSIDACSVVMAVVEGMLNEPVALDVTFHLLATDEEEVYTVYFIEEL